MASPIAILAALAAAFIAALAFALWIIGSPSRSHPACRACRADARGRIWATPVTCALCNASLDAPGAIRARGRQRRGLLLCISACALILAAAILLTDRRIASVGMRWDATFIPVAFDIATLRNTPSGAEAAVDRLWLRTIRGKLSPERASETVEALLALPGGSVPGQWILLNVAGLRASHIADHDRYIDAWQISSRGIDGPDEPLQPGGRIAFRESRVHDRSPWEKNYLVRSITVDGRPLALEGGHSLIEGRLVEWLGRCVALVPEEMPEGDYEAEIRFDELLIPKEAVRVPWSAQEGASIDDLDVKLVRRERTERRPFRVQIEFTRPERPDIRSFGDRDTPPLLPDPPLLAERLPPRTLLLTAIVAALLLPIGLFAGCCLRRFVRGKALLIIPRCTGCRSELHSGALRCSECGRDPQAPNAVRFLRFRTSVLRILFALPLIAALGFAVTIAFVQGVPLLDRWSGDLSTSDRDLDLLEAELIRLADHDLDDQSARSIYLLLAYEIHNPHTPEPDWARITALLPRLLDILERPLSRRADCGDMYMELTFVHERGPDEARALLDAHYQRMAQPLSLEPLRHRAGAWSRVRLDDRTPFGEFYELHAIEGVPCEVMTFEEFFGPESGHGILVPATPGPFEVTLIARPYHDEAGPEVRAAVQLESIPPGEPLAAATINPLRSPFRTPPALAIHQIDDRTAKGRWIATIVRNDGRYGRIEATPFGRWIVEPLDGSDPIDIDSDVDRDRFGPPGTPVILRFEPLPPEEFDPDEAVLLWGVPEAWRVLPEIRPLGYWDGEYPMF